MRLRRALPIPVVLALTVLACGNASDTAPLGAGGVGAEGDAGPHGNLGPGVGTTPSPDAAVDDGGAPGVGSPRDAGVVDQADAAAPAPFAVRAPLNLLVRSGESAPVRVSVARKAGFGGPVTVQIRNLPAGVTAVPRTLPGDVDDAALVLGVERSVGPGARIDALVEASSAAGTFTTPLTVLVAGAPFEMDPAFPASPLSAPNSPATWALPQPDGRTLVVAGLGGDAGLSLSRFDISGARERSFGSGGTVVHALPGVSSVRAAVSAPEGKTLAASASTTCFDGKETACILTVSRHLASGALDAGFAGKGYATVSLGHGLAIGPRLLLVRESAGGVAIVATYFGSDGMTRYAVQRWDGEGVPANGFGTEGLVTFTDRDSDSRSMEIKAAAFVSTGSVRLAASLVDRYAEPRDARNGYVLIEVNASGALTRSEVPLNSSRVVDIAAARDRFNVLVSWTGSTFTRLSLTQHDVETGYRKYPFESGPPESTVLETGSVYELAVDPAGRPFTVGRIRDKTGRAVLRFTQEGNVDTSFGDAGVLWVPGLSGFGGVVYEPLGTMLAYTETGWRRFWP